MMLAIAAMYEELLRDAGVDPEEIADVELVLESGQNLGKLKVKLQPKTKFIDVKLEKGSPHS